MFKTQFNKFVCVGDSIDCESGPYTITARVEYDDTTTPMNYGSEDCYFDTNDPEHGARIKAIIQSWENDEWFYCGIVLSVVHTQSGVVLNEHAASLWGIECNFPEGDNKFLACIANDLINEAIESANDIYESLTK